MSIDQLKNKLDTSLQVFNSELSSLADTADTPSERQIYEQIGRQVFYTLLDFKNILVEYEQSKKRQP